MNSQQLQIHCPAKVNLTLDILGRDEVTGYHHVQTVLHEVPQLFDVLSITTEKEEEVRLTCDKPDVPTDSNNTIFKALEALKQHPKLSDGFPTGLHIHLEKKIPIAAGLGGGSSNAAGLIKALDELWDLQMTRTEKLFYARQVGVDVPFFIVGGAAIGMHYGEQMMFLPTLSEVLRREVVIEITTTGLSSETTKAYAVMDSKLTQCGRRNKNTGKLIKLLKGEREFSSFEDFESLFHNDFELWFFEQHPVIKEKYPQFHLTGTGGALFEVKVREV